MFHKFLQEHPALKKEQTFEGGAGNWSVLFISTLTCIKQVKKPFRKNGRNVGMASTSIGRKEVSFIYVDHTINSARGHDEEDVGWWPRAEFMV